MDDRAIAEALSIFVRNVAVDAASVSVRDGVATIRGAAPSSRDRRAIEDLVAAHDGVRRVENQLAIEVRGFAHPSHQ